MVATDGSIEWVITNHSVTELTREQVLDAVKVRWQVEEFHRSFKQLTGSEKCQCRRASAQRNHLTCCYLAWVSLRQQAHTLRQIIYQTHLKPWSEFLRQQLKNPFVPVLLPASA